MLRRWRLIPALVLALALVTPIAVSRCALLVPRPTVDQTQQVREIAVRVAKALERIGLTAEGVQLAEIALHDAKFVDDEEHRAIQTAFKGFATIVLGSIERAREALSVPELRRTISAVTDGLIELSVKLQAKHPSAAKFLGTAVAGMASVASVILAILN